MAISEQSRHDLHSRLEAVLGADAAAVLMEHLPPVGWADVATKRDLDALEQRIDLKFDRWGAEIRADLHQAIAAGNRTIFFAVIGSNLTMAALAFAAATVR